MLARLLDARLVCRLGNWRTYVDAVIGEDLRLLANFTSQETVERIIESETIPMTLINNLLRCDFRLMYFAHGASPLYNYSVVRHMLVDGSETRATAGEMVRVRPIQAEEEETPFLFPLYARLTPAHLAYPIRCLWAVRHVIGDAAAADLVAYATMAYAVWAYATYLEYGHHVENHPDESTYAKVAQHLFGAQHHPFSLALFLHAIANTGRGISTVRLAKSTRQPRTLVAQLLQRPVSSFAQAALATMAPQHVNVAEGGTLQTDFLAHFGSHVQIFPLGLVSRTRQDTWVVVLHRQAQSQREKEYLRDLRTAVRDAKRGNLRGPRVVHRVQRQQRCLRSPTPPRRRTRQQATAEVAAPPAPERHTPPSTPHLTPRHKTAAPPPSITLPPPSITPPPTPTSPPPPPSPSAILMPPPATRAVRRSKGRPRKAPTKRKAPLQKPYRYLTDDETAAGPSTARRSERIRTRTTPVSADFTALVRSRQASRKIKDASDEQQSDSD